MKPSIRRRFLAVAFFGVATAVIALYALLRILSVTSGQRLDRVRDALVEQVSTLAAADPDAKIRTLALSGPLGLRGGFVGDVEASRVDPKYKVALAQAREKARMTGERSVVEIDGDGSVLLLAVSPAKAGGFAWVGAVVPDSNYLATWRVVVALLVLTTGLLVVTSLGAVTQVRKGAELLRTSLAALAKDLDASVPAPKLRELADVADGIADLSRALSRSEKERDRLNRELAHRARLAALGRVVAGVAHEVRNPLASIKLRLDLAAADPGLGQSYQRDFERAAEEIDRLDRLVRDLLVVAGQKGGVPMAKTALGDLVRERVELLEPWFKERHVTVEARGEASAEVASEAVARAVDNLLRNAVEASPRDGTVHVDVSEAQGRAVIAVEDEGSGVEPAREAELFEPFFTTKSEGTGLGLAISRSTAEAHGGSLAYARREGRTRFELVLGKAAS